MSLAIPEKLYAEYYSSHIASRITLAARVISHGKFRNASHLEIDECPCTLTCAVFAMDMFYWILVTIASSFYFCLTSSEKQTIEWQRNRCERRAQPMRAGERDVKYVQVSKEVLIKLLTYGWKLRQSLFLQIRRRTRKQKMLRN